VYNVQNIFRLDLAEASTSMYPEAAVATDHLVVTFVNHEMVLRPAGGATLHPGTSTLDDAIEQLAAQGWRRLSTTTARDSAVLILRRSA